MKGCNCRTLAECNGSCANVVATPVAGSVPRVFSYISPALVFHFDQITGTAEDLKAARRHLDVLLAHWGQKHG